ncbi:MAG: MBL fold metallo-hydrolase [Candidatus Omnitrophica bacterium]|nr:MBL fold metallo-hydrolase [Candidatus Omnitrophota bacterium]
MQIQTIVVGDYQVNCYILSADQKNAIVIDPGFEHGKITKLLAQEGLTPRIIINTHGHADHIGTNRAWGLPIWIGEGDAAFLNDPARNLSAFFDAPVTSPKAERTLQDGEVCEAYGMTFTVLTTPGHTPGGICLLFDDCVFTGDTLFYASVGRTDLPGSDPRAIIPAINDKLMVLDDRIAVYPGHGPATTIGFERANNYFLR